MDCKQELYVDGLTQLHFAGAMVRFDFARLQPDVTGKEAPPVPEKTERLIMNLHGFLILYDTMQKMIDRLAEAGVLKKNLVSKLDE